MDSPQSRLEEVAEELEFLGPWSERYRALVDAGRQLPPYPEELKTEAHFVSGCVSAVWLTARLEAGVVRFQGASDGVLPQGLVALVVRLFDALPAEAVADFSEDVSQRLDLDRNLTPTRA